MTDQPFALGTFARADGPPFAALVLDETIVVDIGAALRILVGHAALTDPLPTACPSVDVFLADWERSFDGLQALAALVRAEGLGERRLAPAVHAFDGVRALPTLVRPSKILNCAANYDSHLVEMRRYTQTGGGVDPAKIFAGDKSTAQPYFFLKAPSSLAGAHDDIVLPSLADQIDWEAELAVAIGRRARHVKAERALEVIAGYMIFDDVSCRNRLWRADRPNFRTDWLTSKSFDTFGPLGPLFVPRAFVPDHARLRITLAVNGAVKQDGHAGDMIYSPEEQIEYCSGTMTLEPGDVFATGTLGGVCQGTGTFLAAGDVVEITIDGLGRQRNRVVAPPAS